MAHFMPPAIYAFFRPPPPLPFKPPVEQKKMPAYDGLAEYTEAFNTYDMPPPVKNPTPKELREKRKQKHMEKAAKRVKIQESKWDPKSNATPEFTGDAYKTLFVARLAYDVTEEDLRHEFEYYGPVKRVRVVKGKDGKSRGYAFVEFESGRDLKDAYADADGRKIMGRRILVDVERGRTVKNWKPRRLGGGLGGTRIGGKEQNTKFSGRDPAILTGGTGGGHSGSPPRDRREKERVERERRDRGSERDRGGGDRDRDRDRKRERSRSPDRRRRSRTRSRSPRRDRDRDRRR